MVWVRVGGLNVMVRVSVGGLGVIVRVRSQKMHICESPQKDRSTRMCVFMCFNEKQPKLMTRAHFCATGQVEFVIRALLLQYIIAAAGNFQYK